jgi:TorA maturation chaperone TorD
MSRTDDAVDWARLYGVLSECYKHPDERFHEDVAAGRLEAELAAVAEPLGVAVERGVDEDLVPDTVAAFDNEYIALFEAFETPYAPAVESPYKAWYDGAGGEGLLNGPPAADMERRYASLEADVPDAYVPDHLALLLEFAAILAERGSREDHRAFVATHLDWVPAFARLVEDAAADSPFHRRYVAITAELFDHVYRELGVDAPDQGDIETMIERVEEGIDGLPEEKTFRP